MSRSISVACLSHMASARAPTGAEHSLLLLATGLARRGNLVRVVAPAPWALERRLAEADIEVAIEPCRVCWMTYYGPRPWATAALKWIACRLPDPGAGRLRRRLEAWKPDVVHVNCLPHVVGASVARGAGFPVVWHLREILPPGARRRWFARRLRSDADRIVAVSEAVAAWVREEGLGERVHVVHNGVEVESRVIPASDARRILGLPKDGCFVGLYGQMLPHKGVIEFVRAGRIALDLEPTLRFVLAGPGPRGFLRRVEREIRATGAEGRFHLLASRPSGETLTAAADLVCLTTMTPDPLPRVVLESMAAGKPVVAFRSGGTAEMVLAERTGLLVQVGDVDGLAASVVRMARDPAMRAAMGRAGADRARERFSVRGHLERMEAVLREVARP